MFDKKTLCIPVGFIKRWMEPILILQLTIHNPLDIDIYSIRTCEKNHQWLELFGQLNWSSDM